MTTGHDRKYRWCADKEFSLAGLPVRDSLDLGQRRRETMGALSLGGFDHSRHRICPSHMPSTPAVNGRCGQEKESGDTDSCQGAGDTER